jgi:hypothetical protein
VALGFPSVARERQNKRYKITLAKGGAAFLIHLLAGNHPLTWGSAFSATVPRGLYRLPKIPKILKQAGPPGKLPELALPG